MVPETTRKLVTIRQIDAITPIENADKIETYHIGGWTVVDQKGKYQVGDNVLYLEIDSLIPLDDDRFKSFEERGVTEFEGKRYHRLKTIKLRGQVSQGLILPLTILNSEIQDLNKDYSQELGVIKYEPPMPAQLRGKQSRWPDFIEKTDEIRIQTLISDNKKFADAIFLDKENWIPYQKIDGTSISIYSNSEGKIGIYSRNFEIIEENTYWQVAKELSLKDIPLLVALSAQSKERGITIIFQGELFGEGIQKNPLGIKGQTVRFFTIQEYNEQTRCNIRLTPEQILEDKFYSQIYNQLWVPILDVQIPNTLEELINQPNGLTNQVKGGNNSQIEGIVWRHKFQSIIKVPKEKTIDISKIPEDKRELVLAKIGDTTFDLIKASFKCISSNYLLKHDG